MKHFILDVDVDKVTAVILKSGIKYNVVAGSMNTGGKSDDPREVSARPLFCKFLTSRSNDTTLKVDHIFVSVDLKEISAVEALAV